MRRTFSLIIPITLLVSGCQKAPEKKAAAPERLEFTRLVAHWTDYVDPGYLKFIEDAQPEIVQVGFYGADFFSLAHTPETGKGLSGPLLPHHGGAVKGANEAERLKANTDYYVKLNRELHQRGVKVIGHFAMAKYLLGAPSPQGPQGGFFKFYRDLWDEKELGPKPVPDPVQVIEKNADGSPLFTPDEDAAPFKVYYGCSANPHWRAVLKAWVKRGIDMGLDGFMINYFYRNNCLCEHCKRGFKQHLKEHFTPPELRRQFGIDNLDTHEFAEIVARHDFKTTTPLRIEMQRFSDIVNKQAFDEVFIQYGRSLKPGLIVAQWLHAYQPWPTSDERAMLPTELWGKGEDYLWYSVGQNEPTLFLRYIRGAFEDKPYTVGKYETVRIRRSMAELAANGGAPMGRYVRFPDPFARQEHVRYYQFIKRYDAIYRANLPHAEAVLLYPRSLIHRGQFHESLGAFQEVGMRLLDEHVLLDVVPDEVITDQQLAGYRRVFTVSSRDQMSMEKYDSFSRFEGPKTVRVSASHPPQGGEIDLHFVNYDREEPKPPAKATGAADEKPIAVPEMKVDFVLPSGATVAKVEVITPEQPDPVEVKAETASGRLRFTVPKFLVYSVARIHLAQ